MAKQLHRYLESRTLRRKNRVRMKLRARNRDNRYRLSVFRSGQYVYAQIIDDQNHCTLASASTLEKSASLEGVKGKNCQAAAWVGSKIAQRAKDQGIEKVVLDRGSYCYHGRIKALADAARQAGLSF